MEKEDKYNYIKDRYTLFKSNRILDPDMSFEDFYDMYKINKAEYMKHEEGEDIEKYPLIDALRETCDKIRESFKDMDWASSYIENYGSDYSFNFYDFDGEEVVADDTPRGILAWRESIMKSESPEEWEDFRKIELYRKIIEDLGEDKV